ncbi:polyribonucleotide nucleotidyltransferase [Gammaproteobacteria bacterium]|nr:polyribonucleotide nucleotidyltransferase [Gammaproteobacteria bacterium]
MNPIIKKFQYGKDTVTLETGRIARQATGAVLCSINETSVLCTVVGEKIAKEGMDFFPLGVHYIEKSYSAGKIPGGYFKREGRPTEKETLTSRLIDRPIRPLFPDGFKNEVQVICNVVSSEKDTDPDIAAMIGTSAAIAISGIPFNGPVGAARVGYSDNEGYLLNPRYEDLQTSDLDMVVAGTKDAVLMVESEAKELSEDIMLGGVLYAHQEMQSVITVIQELADEVSRPKWDWSPQEVSPDLISRVKQGVSDNLNEAYQITNKSERSEKIAQLKATICKEIVDENEFSEDDVKAQFKKLEKEIVRGRILDGNPRIDGRDSKSVRGINVSVGMLPRVHGSAIFTRGETQALVTATLASTRDSQIIDALEGKKEDPFMLHYNFPPFSVGECGRVGFTSRREIGHGRLARRGVSAVLPTVDDFPYAIRVVSEITESNGSSSMASVCGASLALMDAGVPLKAPVAGIAMGLVKEGEKFAVLTDILGDEDHLGDMDFKVAGTADGVTALQMDIKIEGITEEIMEIALDQALAARLSILSDMNKVLSSGREEIAESAPRLQKMQIDSDKIRDVIGKGGATIRGLCDEHNSTIDISDDGVVQIYSEDQESLANAVEAIKAIVADPEPGMIYDGKVVRIVDFGAFVNFMPGTDGLVHISQIAQERVEKVTDYLTEGQDVKVKVIEIDNRGRVKLSIKEAQSEKKEGSGDDKSPDKKD